MNLVLTTVHSLMNRQLSSSLARAILEPDDTGVVIYSKPHPSRTCKTRLLLVPLDVRGQAGCSAFLSICPLIRLCLKYKKYKTVLIPKLKMCSYILDIYNKM